MPPIVLKTNDDLSVVSKLTCFVGHPVYIFSYGYVQRVGPGKKIKKKR